MKTVMISSLVEREKLLKRVIYQKSVGIIWNKKSKELDRCVSMNWWWWIAHPTLSPGEKGTENNSLHHSLKNTNERTALKNLWTVPSKPDWGEAYVLPDIDVKSKVLEWQRPCTVCSLYRDKMSTMVVTGSRAWAVQSGRGPSSNIWAWLIDRGVHETEVDGQTNKFFLNLSNKNSNTLLVGEHVPDMSQCSGPWWILTHLQTWDNLQCHISWKKRVMDLFKEGPETLPSTCTLSLSISPKMFPWPC